jgi:hypothetical protein
MSGHAAKVWLRREEAGLVLGMTWLPIEALDALVYGSGAEGPAESLATVAGALDLDFMFVPAHEPWAAEAVGLLHESGVAAFASVAGVLGRVGESVGWLEMLKLTAVEPGGLAAPFAAALHEALDEVRTAMRFDADAIVVADDVAGATGPLVSPDFALDALVPCYRALAGEAAAHEVPSVFHSDGDIRALMPALARGGFSGVHVAGVSEDGFVASMVAAHAAKLVVLGGIEAASLLRGARHHGAQAGSLARAGGLLVCDDGGLTGAEEVAAYASALDAAREAYAAESDTP